MKLTVRDVAKMLKVSEKVIYRWIYKEELPAYRMNDQYRINRTELLEWASSRQISIPAEIFPQQRGLAVAPSLTSALKAGGIFYGVKGVEKETILWEIVQLMRLPHDVDRNNLLKILLAREAMASTGVGNGIAIPHVRNPLIFPVPTPLITLCFLENPVEFGAIDRKPVHTLFTIVSSNVRHHLYLLSRLAFTLREPSFKEFLERRASESEIMTALSRVESGFRSDSGEEKVND